MICHKNNQCLKQYTTLLKQIIFNYHYIEKYYQRKDVLNEKLCQLYQIKIVKWLMKETKILSKIMHADSPSKKLLNSFNIDYCGQIIVLSGSEGDLTSDSAVESAFKRVDKIDVVYHIAALVGPFHSTKA